MEYRKQNLEKSMLQVHGRARMLFSHRPWLRVYIGPDNDGKCAATRALDAHLPAHIRAIHKEWRRTLSGCVRYLTAGRVKTVLGCVRAFSA